MKLLEGKKALIFGVANKRSIAWAIAQTLHEHGAEIGISYGIPQLEKRVFPLAEQLGVTFVEKCDVTSDEEIEDVFAKAAEHFGQIDILVHSVAYAPSEELEGMYVDTSRAGFSVAMDISVYSLVALTKAALPLMAEGGSILCMTYYGAEKVVPHYNVMGVAKAALEASMRYLAAELGQQDIRVNAISAGPIRTLSAAGVSGFKRMHREFSGFAPLRKSITIEDIGGAAVWLASDLASKVTGEVLFVDSGYNILGIPDIEEG